MYMKKYSLILAVIFTVLIAIYSCEVFSQPSSVQTRTSIGQGCPALGYQVGYKIAHYDGVKAAEWYPSATAEQSFAYSPDISSSLAKDGLPLQGCGTFPLIIFSHGLTGCGIQSIFFTETLARNGYIVVAPDHQDALSCSVDGTSQTPNSNTEPPIANPKSGMIPAIKAGEMILRKF